MGKERKGESLGEVLEKRFSGAGRIFKEELMRAGILKEVPKNSILYYPGAVCDFVPVVLNGRVKVYLITNSGRELLLYDVLPGESCLLTNLSVLKDKPYPAYAVTYENSSIFLIESTKAKLLFNKFQEWRDFVLDMFVKDGWQLASHMSEVVSKRVDVRLAEYLLHQSQSSNPIRATHEEVARDIVTVREVVTRILKKFEAQGLVSLKRGEIRLVDIDGLRRLSEK